MQATLRLLSLVLCLVGLSVGGAALRAQEAAPRPLAQAMDAMRGGDWAEARRLAEGDGKVAVDIIEWHRLRAGRGAPEHVMEFIAERPDWPGMDWLRRKSEAAIAGASDEVILAFFDGEAAQTATGALALAGALDRRGDRGAAEIEIVLAWRTMQMGETEQAGMLAGWSDLLAPHHEARLDHALWNGWESDARRMLPLVSDGWKALALARLGLRDMAGNVDSLIAAVPASLADHPGLAYERYEWRMRKRRTADALELLVAHSATLETLGEPDPWARRRGDLARDLMRDGDMRTAYAVAANHHLVDGSTFASLEWLAGFLALRKLDDPALAAQHFRAFRGAVETPISIGRAGYWLGRALEEAGDADGARAAYAEGAAYQTSFYGLLAAEAGGLPFDAKLAGDEDFGDWQQAGFTKSSVFDAFVLLLAADEIAVAERFITHLAESQDRTGMGQMGAMLDTLGQPHIGVMLGKRAAQFGIEVAQPYYAIHPVAQMQHPVPTEMVLSIARRESEFDPRVVSGAGARGLMQVMPATAQAMAGELGLGYDGGKLLSDWSYNARLGAHYLSKLAREFDGNVVMMSAGYNAGPSRPRRWMEQYGDPRRGEIDVIDWIETIPFDETRNYVMRVAESLPVYRARLGHAPHPVPFSQELVGTTLLPTADR
ncbi:lytic transglycosylase domain-containing protein [Mesobacterium pallidum]|uniref:lytic transglycosylase domain-containing protein n=1 Tax=Mesobacterium pallidum TaxID=2872037 RepID=UPI001EE235C6|nr:lytic transglycosylase domain-containing protein [Mesobacterium pallidum]